jgi:GNAT superfamily N-acetyltransferase
VVSVRPVSGAAASALCAALTAGLPLWFGRPDANARYIAGITGRECYAADAGGHAAGLIALEHQTTSGQRVCNIWWLAVAADQHRQGIGRALISHAIAVALQAGFERLTVETVGPQHISREYALTRLFYDSMGFSIRREFDGIMVEMELALTCT